MAPNPWEHFDAARIASATGCPLANVEAHWPRLVEQLAHAGINDRATQIAMIGTVAIETASTFAPVREAFWLSEDWRRANLTRYYPYYGRGFIQLTWESNYRAYGQKVDRLWEAGGVIDLAAHPDDALDPDISAAVAAVYFRDHGGDGQARIPKAARAGDWREVRRLVQGGSAGLDRLERIAASLGGAPAAPVAYVFPVQGYAGPVNLHWNDPAGIGGTDLFARQGTPVLAVTSGTVVYYTDSSPIGGNAVQIAHDGDGLQSYYAHGDHAPAVKLGQRVEAGQYIFGVGDSGNARGKGHHLHFGMGREISTASGVQGGCGTDFDAVAFLRGLLGTPAPAPTPPAPPVDPRDAEIERLKNRVAELETIRGYLTRDVAGALQAAVDALRAHAPT